MPIGSPESLGHLRNQCFGHQIGFPAAVGREGVDVDAGRLLDDFRDAERRGERLAEADQSVVLKDDGSRVWLERAVSSPSQ